MKYTATVSGESWDHEFEQALKALNTIVLAHGEPIEGNACYWDLELKDPNQRPDGRILKRRQALGSAAKSAGRVLEIGVNAGHAALLMLASNPALDYFGVDIGAHAYTVPALRYLNATGRAKGLIGDSAKALPVLRVDGVEPFDLIHIDGAHDLAGAVTDLVNARGLLQQGGTVIVDDMHLPGPLEAVLSMVGDGWYTGSIGEHVAELRLP
ncbi:MAG: class I SAM-dependent methyltransferase [Phycisphaerae bacterium]